MRNNSTKPRTIPSWFFRSWAARSFVDSRCCIVHMQSANLVGRPQLVTARSASRCLVPCLNPKLRTVLPVAQNPDASKAGADPGFRSHCTYRHGQTRAASLGRQAEALRPSGRPRSNAPVERVEHSQSTHKRVRAQVLPRSMVLTSCPTENAFCGRRIVSHVRLFGTKTVIPGTGLKRLRCFPRAAFDWPVVWRSR